MTSALKSKLFDKKTFFALFKLFDEYICSHNMNWLLYYRMSYKSTINSCQLCWKKKECKSTTKLLLDKASQGCFSLFLRCLINLHVCL